MYSPGGEAMSARVQFVLTDNEYEQLKAIVKKDGKGVSISKYVKDKVFPKEDSFEVIWEEFANKLDAFPTNIEFDVANVMTQQRWNTLDRSSKLSLARLFNKKVTTKEYANIKLIGRSRSNVSIYKKVS
jgi:ribosomal protein L15